MSNDIPEITYAIQGEIVESGRPPQFQTLYILFYINRVTGKWVGTYPQETAEKAKESGKYLIEDTHYRIYEIQLPTNP